MKRSTFFKFAGPSIFTMIILMVIPLIIAIWLSLQFMTFTNITDPVYVGLQNYIDVLGDPQFWQSFQFTTLYMVIVVPMIMLIGFVIALLLDQVSRLYRGVYLSIFLLPFIIVPVVGTLMFKQLFVPSGLFTWIYQSLTESRFFFNEVNVKTLIILHGIWLATPFALVTYFAGLQTLKQDLIEAASIDGANRWQMIRHIVIPHLRSLTIFILLIAIMDSYRIFDSVFVLTGNNPIYKADTIMTYNFNTALILQRLGKANAMSVLTVIGIMVFLIPNLIQSYKEQIADR
jgi:multiple sugar transport system permease protein